MNARLGARTTRDLRPPSRRAGRALVAAAALWLVWGAPAAGQSPDWRFPAAARVVVVADVHGAYAELAELLQTAGLVDADLAWRGGDAVLVSLGDLIDRGPGSRPVLDLMMRLQREAPPSGGAVHVVLGNHEAMNLAGDWRYVVAEDYAAFAAEERADDREAAFRELAASTTDESAEALRALFDRRYPPGYFARRAAFGRDGVYGRWLLSLPALIVVGDTAFVHGGLSPLVAATPPAEINARIDSLLQTLLLATNEETADAARAAADAAPELGLDGPLWYRGTAYCNALLERPVLEGALAALGVQRVVMGHTPSEDRRVRALYGGRAVMLDTGMLTSYFNGRPAALLIEGATTAVQYLAPRERAGLERGALAAYAMTDEALRALLANGALDGQPGRGNGAGPVTVRDGERSVQARFYAGRRAEHELAAHALDRLLGLGLVPPTVPREVAGRAGALQLSYPGAVSEAERVQSKRTLGDWCALPPQFELMSAFDALTADTRTAETLLYTPAEPLVKLVDHGGAFGRERRLPPAAGARPVPAPLRAALAALDEPSLGAALGAWLGGAEIAALLARRDALLALPPPP
jgi:Calcineurin-like phosphoesterase